MGIRLGLIQLLGKECKCAHIYAQEDMKNSIGTEIKKRDPYELN